MRPLCAGRVISVCLATAVVCVSSSYATAANKVQVRKSACTFFDEHDQQSEGVCGKKKGDRTHAYCIVAVSKQDKKEAKQERKEAKLERKEAKQERKEAKKLYQPQEGCRAN